MRSTMVVVTVCLALCPVSTAQPMDDHEMPVQRTVAPEGMPTPAEIIERHLDVTGGRAAHARVKNRRSVGTFRQGEEGAPVRIVINEAAPSRRHVSFETGGAPMLFITNEDEDWRYEGDIILRSEGEHRRQAIQRAQFQPMLRWGEIWTLAKNLGHERVNGRLVYRVRLMDEECHKTYLSFDVESGRHIRTEQEINYQGQILGSVTDITEYAEFDGLLLPRALRRVLTVNGAPQLQLYEMTEVGHNVDLPADLFATPPELAPAPGG